MIDKWEGIFLDTAYETVDEKIDSLLKQERYLRKIQRQMIKFIEEYKFKEIDNNDDSEQTSTEDSDKEELVSLLYLFNSITFPLSPHGIKDTEQIDMDENEFSVLLDEAKMSLKRSLSFVGGIVRGYLKQGQKNDKWVENLRRIESRSEPVPLSFDIPDLKFEHKSFKSETHLSDFWKIISDLYKYRENIPLRSELCKQLSEGYESYSTEIEFYLPQLLLLIINIKDFKELENVILLRSRLSIHFAIKVYLFMSSFGNLGTRKWIRRCKKFLKKLEIVIPTQENLTENIVDKLFLDSLHAKSPNNSEIVPKPDKETRKKGKQYFFDQINFLHDLVKICLDLVKFLDKEPDQLSIEMKNCLEGIQKYIDNGLAYLPFTTSTRHRVVRYCTDESYPIATSLRVLCWLVFEVVPVPNTYSSVDVSKYISLPDTHDHIDSAREDDSSNEEKQYSIFGESKEMKEKKVKQGSPFGALKNWGLRNFLTKNGDFVLQEQFALQLINQFRRIFEEEGLPHYICTYNIFCVTAAAGLIEVIPNSVSLNTLKEKSQGSLLEFFKTQWPKKEDFNKARTNFVRSVAAYSLLCYFLQIKDRHNGNIMLDHEGHIVHIDFGYILSRTIKFEKAPFKLTDEYIELLGGKDSKGFKQYIALCIEGFLAIRRHYEKILLLVEMTINSEALGTQICPCLSDDEGVLLNLRKRFKLRKSEPDIQNYVYNLIGEAIENWRTEIYDAYQRILNNINI